jgi:hypothetical protein
MSLLLLFLLATSSSKGLFQVPLQSVCCDARLRPWQHNLQQNTTAVQIDRPASPVKSQCVAFS